MSALPASLSFCLPMAKKEQTTQLGTRIKTTIKRRAENFCVHHPLQPSLAAVIELALTRFLDSEEPALPAAPPRRPAK